MNVAPRILLTVSGVVGDEVHEQIAAGRRPRADWAELARAMGADVLDVAEARRRSGRVGRLAERLGGTPVLLALTCFLERGRYDAFFTDGEHVGLPLALLLSFARRPPAHVMVGHILSTRSKTAMFRLFRLGRRVDRIVLYSSWQLSYVTGRLHYPESKALLSTFMVDTDFWAPAAVTPSSPVLVGSAGLERRDYPTLLAAVASLDGRVVIAAASPWSRRPDTSAGAAVPPNVEVRSLNFTELRQLYADAAVVVVPLEDVDFQAGVTTILEAMSMGKPVICTRTRGQTDVIADGVTGSYVPPADPVALRAAVDALLGDPVEAGRLGANARRAMVAGYDIEQYAARLARVTVAAAVARPTKEMRR